MKYLYIAIFVLSLSVLGSTFAYNTPSVSAHQSGCHRWHSCPSDSGSYTCGDTGYTSGCGESTYTAPVVSYTSQGLTNGKKHATTDEMSIESIARTEGDAAGMTDGQSGAIKLPNSQSTPTCRKTFNFETAQDPLYVSGYESGYQSICSTTFDTAYKLAYALSYSIAKTAHEAAIAKEAAEKESTENAIWTWVILGGIGIWAVSAIAQKNK